MNKDEGADRKSGSELVPHPAAAIFSAPEGALADATPVALVLREGLSKDEWVRIGTDLLGGHRRLQWYWGDWLRYGEDKGYIPHGRYDDAQKLTDYNRATLRDLAWVARAIPSSRRRDDLPWSHHREVAGLDAADQERLLEGDARGEWSREQLRLEVARVKVGIARSAPSDMGSTDADASTGTDGLSERALSSDNDTKGAQDCVSSAGHPDEGERHAGDATTPAPTPPPVTRPPTKSAANDDALREAEALAKLIEKGAEGIARALTGKRQLRGKWRQKVADRAKQILLRVERLKAKLVALRKIDDVTDEAPA